MKSQVEKVSSLQRKINIEVPADVVNQAFTKVFADIQKQVEIKGFRKGKAPINTIKSMYSDRVKQDVAQDLIQMHYSKALNEHKLDPISYPEFEFDELNEHKDFSFSAHFDIRPEVQIKKIAGVEVLKEKFTSDDSKVDQVLENIRNSRASLVDVLEQRPAQNGDTAIVDFEGFVDGKPLEGGTGKDHSLELGSKSFIDGFEEGIVGMTIGGQKTLNLKFPTPYHSAELAGKPVEFKVTLNGLKKKSLPELTEEFVKTLGGPATLEELKETIKKDLEQSEQKRIDDSFKNRLLKTLVKENPVEVPQSLLKEQKQALIEDFKKRMTEQGMGEAEYQDYVQKWDGDFNKTAGEMIQSSFLVDAIARQNDLVCNEADLEKRFDEYAKQTGIDIARIKEFYSKPEQTSRLTYAITEEKVIAHLLTLVKIKEVDKKDIKEEEN